MEANDIAKRSYSRAEHGAALIHVRRVLEEGGTIAQAATELRIPKNTVYSWHQAADGRRGKKAKSKTKAKIAVSPVRIVRDPPQPTAAIAMPSLVVVAPRELRIEGLDINGLAALVRALD